MHGTRLHSEHGASKAKRWMACPGSVAAERDLPDVSSEYSIEGTAAHELAERALAKGMDCIVWLDSDIPVVSQNEDGTSEIVPVTVTEEMCEAVQQFVDYVRENTSDKRQLEVRFDLAPLNPPAPMFGTADVADWTGRKLKVIDLKYGQGVVVEAEENEQLMYYALGAVTAAKRKPSEITVVIVQPRGYHHAGPVRSFTFTYERLVEFKRELWAAGERTLDPHAPRVAGEHCRFCRAKPTCPALYQLSVDTAQSEFAVVEATPPAVPSELTVEQIGRVLQHGKVVEDFVKSVREHALKMLMRGEEVPGFKLVDGRSNRRWADEARAKPLLENMLGEDAYTKKFVSPAQAEKLLKVTGTKLPPQLVEKVPSGKRLAPDTDSRPARLPSAQEDFTTESSQS